MAHILVIDPDLDTHRNLKLNLESLQYQIFSATSATEGFEKAMSQFPDIIIMELEFTDKPGLNLLKQLKNQEIVKDIPILILSRLTDKNMILNALKSGGMDYILKPFDTHVLTTKLNRIWKHVLNIRMRNKVGVKDHPITVKRNGWQTFFFFPIPISVVTVDKFKEIYTDHFKKVTLREQYFLDLRNQATLEENQVKAFIMILKIINRFCFIIAGKSYAILSQEDEIDTTGLFLSLADAEKYLASIQGTKKSDIKK